MADKEIFQNVNEIDLEALIDNTQGGEKYMIRDKFLKQYF